ncbi:MAG: exported protein of unknown function [Candidatus Saccharibacteria bacterium]|nr:exported protein of unknown function [Candidatus Saccharibacteria bacterium]
MKYPVSHFLRGKRLLVGIVIAICLLALGILWAIPALQRPKPTINNKPAAVTPVTESRLTIAAMGDMLAHDTIIAGAKTTSGYDFSPYFSHIRPRYKDADLVFCNQEGPSAGSDYGISGYPSFNAPVEFSQGLKDGAGCNLINLANNHMGDGGTDVTSATLDVWANLHPLIVTGANKTPEDQQKVSYVDKNGIRLALLAFADFNNNTATPGYSVNNYHNEALVRRLVSEARKSADLVIVSMHWGTEDSAAVNDDQRAQVALLASLGVDIIIGTGPHVLQPVESVKRSDGGTMIVWYSLGNMLSSQLEAPQLFSGVATMSVTKSKDKTLSVDQLGFLPTYMHYDWSDADAAAGNLASRTHPMIYPLDEAEPYLARSQLSTTVREQRDYIVRTLGPSVTVK